MLNYVITIIYIISFLVVMYMLLKIYNFIIQTNNVFKRKKIRLQTNNKLYNSLQMLKKRRDNELKI